MSTNVEQLKQWINEISHRLVTNTDPESLHFASFLQDPKLSTELIDIIAALPEENIDNERSYYSACIFALEICISQFQGAIESGNKMVDKLMLHVMDYLAEIIINGKHTLSFWLPILNAFYDVHVDLNDNLRNAYLHLAEQEEIEPGEEIDHLSAIQNMINELGDLSPYDIAENFFAQSYAMPPDFFAELLVDLYSIKEGQDIGLLALLHPQTDVREIVVSVHDQILPQVTLSSESLTRLQRIRTWFPEKYHDMFNRWIKEQRKKGVLFVPDDPWKIVSIQASEIDGTGAQGIFVHIRRGRKNCLCGLLLRYGVGIKDTWITPPISTDEIKRYHQEAFDNNVTLRKMDMDYLQLLTNHFLANTLECGHIPDLHFLELQELLGLHSRPQSIDMQEMMENFSIQISPFTQDVLEKAIKTSRNWLLNASYTESWYLENANIDKLVNRHSNFVDGVKLCNLDEAVDAVIEHELEVNRKVWLHHFLWVSLWLKTSSSSREKQWQTCFLIAYAIKEGRPIRDLPIMQEIAKQSVLNSIDTMNERRTHLA